jgi:pimeloyl-ACP methyl ester carboxylesterase
MILHGITLGQETLGPGPPLVLLHGLFGSARNFGAVQRALAKRFRVIALDLRNHGASPHAEAMDYAVMAADVIDTLLRMQALPAAVLGHSLGGKVAMRLALDRPDAVSALIVADIAPVPYPPHFQDYVEAMLAVPSGSTRAAADARLAPVVPDQAIRGFLLQNLQPEGTTPWRLGLAEIAAALPAIGDWNVAPGQVYRGPTLFIAGERSDYIRPEYRPTVRVLFPAARFITLRGAGHWLHAEKPEAFVEVVGGFLAAAEADARNGK